ncbi:MAG: hypothetical protein HEEMFOPI_00971 [Holosporales bacterium]
MHIVFDRSKILKQARDVYLHKRPHFILEHAAKTVVERLKWRRIKPLNVLILGAFNYALVQKIQKTFPEFLDVDVTIQHENIFFDSEALPFDKQAFDCILSFFDMQSINDIPGHLKQLSFCLKPDGFFTSIYIGGQSFNDLRRYMLQKELDVLNQTTLRFHPTISMEDGAYLLQRAGFDCPLSDHDLLKVDHLTFIEVLKAFQHYKITNALKDPPNSINKDLYYHIITDKKPIPFSFDIVYLTALGKRLSLNCLKKSEDLMRIKEDEFNLH